MPLAVGFGERRGIKVPGSGRAFGTRLGNSLAPVWFRRDWQSVRCPPSGSLGVSLQVASPTNFVLAVSEWPAEKTAGNAVVARDYIKVIAAWEKVAGDRGFTTQ